MIIYNRELGVVLDTDDFSEVRRRTGAIVATNSHYGGSPHSVTIFKSDDSEMIDAMLYAIGDAMSRGRRGLDITELHGGLDQYNEYLASLG